MYPTQTHPNIKLSSSREGFKQENEVDYDEIFSPVVKMTTLRLLLGVMAIEDLELEELDVKTALLHKDLEEDIYMSQPAHSQIRGRNLTSYVDLRKASMA